MTSHLHTVSLARLSRPTTSHNYCGLSEGTTQIRLQIPPERHTGAKHGIVGLISTHTSRGMWARCCALHRRGACGWAVESWRVGVGQVSQIVLTHWKAKTRTRYSSGGARRLAKCPCCLRPCVDNHRGTYIAQCPNLLIWAALYLNLDVAVRKHFPSSSIFDAPHAENTFSLYITD